MTYCPNSVRLRTLIMCSCACSEECLPPDASRQADAPLVEVFIPFGLQDDRRILRNLRGEPRMFPHGTVELFDQLCSLQATSTVSCGLTRRESWGASFSIRT